MSNLSNLRQNHPELLVRDFVVPGNLPSFLEEHEKEALRYAFKQRGVNKWFRVRRLLIKLSRRWKEQIKVLEEKKKELRKKLYFKQYFVLRGYVNALVDCRQQIRALCHSSRDVDFPESSHDFGVFCEFPEDLPSRPNKKWILRHDQNILEGKKDEKRKERSRKRN